MGAVFSRPVLARRFMRMQYYWARFSVPSLCVASAALLISGRQRNSQMAHYARAVASMIVLLNAARASIFMPFWWVRWCTSRISVADFFWLPVSMVAVRSKRVRVGLILLRIVMGVRVPMLVKQLGRSLLLHMQRRGSTFGALVTRLLRTPGPAPLLVLLGFLLPRPMGKSLTRLSIYVYVWELLLRPYLTLTYKSGKVLNKFLQNPNRSMVASLRKLTWG